MANAVNTGSTLTHPNGKNKTSTASSTQIIIKVGGVAVGAIQKLQVSEKRQVTFFDEVGQDGHFDSMPTQSTKISGTCERIRFDRLRAAQAFRRGFVHVQSQVFPFDINIYDIQNGDENSDGVLITTLKNVWINGMDYAFSSDNWVITDNMSWECEHIYSELVGGGAVGLVGSERTDVTPEGFTFENPSTGGVLVGDVEQQADTGQRRGSFDIASIIDIVGNI